MPVPFNDVTASMRINAEKTETALKKVNNACVIYTMLTSLLLSLFVMTGAIFNWIFAIHIYHSGHL